MSLERAEPGRPEVAQVDLDVRTVRHYARHTVVFAHLDELEVGETFVILSDSDPQPLRHQIDILSPDAFEWRYLEAGPALWRVEIERAG